MSVSGQEELLESEDWRVCPLLSSHLAQNCDASENDRNNCASTLATASRNEIGDEHPASFIALVGEARQSSNHAVETREMMIG